MLRTRSGSRPVRASGATCFPRPPTRCRRGPVDYLMLDYLAEVTMSIMQKQRARDPAQGYARDFVQVMADILPDCVARTVRVVANAGGVNPRACSDAVLAGRARRPDSPAACASA